MAPERPTDSTSSASTSSRDEPASSQPTSSATATCYCGAVQLAFPTHKRALIDTFTCHCEDCRKITASMFATNFILRAAALRHVRGRERLTRFARSDVIATGNTMASFFCSVCGSLMYRVSSGSPGFVVMRAGVVDDLALHATVLRPRLEQFCSDRVDWLEGVQGSKQVAGNHFDGRPKGKGTGEGAKL